MAARLVVLVTAVAGCAPHHLLPPPPDMPAEVRGRRLWHTPRAYIYAREGATAAETDAWLEQVSAYLRGETARDPGKGVVIVNDVGDEPVIASLSEALALRERVRRRLSDEPKDGPADSGEAAAEASAAGDSEAGGAAQGEQQVRDLVEAGLEEKTIVAALSLPLDGAALAAVGVPPDRAPWAVAVPSRRLAEQIMPALVRAAVEKQQGSAAAAAIMPFVPLVSAEAAKSFLLAREMAVLSASLSRQAGWSAARRREVREAYLQRRLEELYGAQVAQRIREARAKGARSRSVAERASEQGKANSRVESH